MKSIAKVQRECKANDPPIEPNQEWVARNSRKEIVRRMRILAQMPEPTGLSSNGRVWIYEEKPSFMMHETRLGKVPEFNLRFVFRLHKAGT